MTSAKKKKGRIRWLWWAKWSGAGLSALITIAFATSLCREMLIRRYVTTAKGTGYVSVTLEAGGITLGISPPHLDPTSPLPPDFSNDEQTVVFYDSGVFPYSAAGLIWWVHAGSVSLRTGTSILVLTIPLWIPFLLFALPTIRLFMLDKRHHRPDCCAFCGYSLTGNTSGTCPECGATPARAAT